MSRRSHNKLIVDQLKEAFPCQDCGQYYPAEAMDLDHVRGAPKVGNISDLLHLPGKDLAAEIAKCDLVCSSCHRIRTRDRRLDASVDLALDADLEQDLLI